jgi:hypothetical protein
MEAAGMGIEPHTHVDVTCNSLFSQRPVLKKTVIIQDRDKVKKINNRERA